MGDHKHQLAQILLKALRPALNEVLAERVGRHVSQHDWEQITEEAAAAFLQELMQDDELATLLDRSQLHHSDGKPNFDGVVRLLDEAARQPGPRQPQLTHLCRHMRHTLTEANLLKESPDEFQPDQPRPRVRQRRRDHARAHPGLPGPVPGDRARG